MGEQLVRIELQVMVDLDAYAQYCYQYPGLVTEDGGPAATLAREAIAAFEANGLLVANQVHDPEWKEITDEPSV